MENTVRCPYCASGSEFRRMVAHVDGRYICSKCGHIERPGDPEYKCRCSKCVDPRVAHLTERSRRALSIA